MSIDQSSRNKKGIYDTYLFAYKSICKIYRYYTHIYIYGKKLAQSSTLIEKSLSGGKRKFQAKMKKGFIANKDFSLLLLF